MVTAPFVSTYVIRTIFSIALSDMYKSEVPQYRALMKLVSDINGEVLAPSFS